jgi:hypothetical protein
MSATRLYLPSPTIAQPVLIVGVPACLAVLERSTKYAERNPGGPVSLAWASSSQPSHAPPQ